MSRIYASEQASNRYKGRNRAVGFAPVTTVNDAKAIQQYAAARDQDARVIAGDIARQMNLDNLELQALQQAETANLRVDQTYKAALENKKEISQNQLLEQSQLRQQQDLQVSQTELEQGTALLNLQQDQALSRFDLQSKQGLAKSQLDQQQTLKASQQQETQLLELSQLMDSNALRMQSSAANSEQFLNQQYVTAKGRVAQANTQAIGSTIKGLIKLSGSLYNYFEEQKEEVEQEKIQTEQLDAIGLNLNSMVGGVDSQVQEVAQTQSTVIESESQALNNVADGLNGNSAIDIHTESQLRQGTTWKALESVRGNVYAARAMYPAALAEAAANGVIRPGAQGYADAEKFTRSFASATGLLSADPARVAEVFSDTALQEIQQTVLRVTNEHQQGIIEANKQTVENAVSTIVDGSTPSNIGAAFDASVKEVAHGNIGFNPSEKKRAATHALDLMLKNLSSEGTGNLTSIKALRNHVYNKSSGRKLGQDFDNVFDQYEDDAVRRNINNFNQNDTLVRHQVKTLEQSFNLDSSESNYRNVMEQLEGINHPDAYAARSRLAKLGVGYDPNTIIELDEQLKRDGYVNPAVVQNLILQGYDAKELERFTINPVQRAAMEKVDEALRGRNYADDLAGTTNARDFSAKFMSQLQTRKVAFREQLKSRVAAEVAVNPKLANDPQALAKVIDVNVEYLKGLPQYQVADDPTGPGASFKGELNPQNAMSDKLGLTVSGRPGVQDFSGVTTKQLNTFFKAQVNIGSDRLYTQESIQPDLKILIEGDGSQPFSNRTIELSKLLGVSPKALLNEQFKVIGGPGVAVLERQQMQAVPTTPDIPDMRVGFNALKGLGVPERGAAYLAGNIETESSWYGQRKPWDDVGAPAGGLVSWRASRLDNIQRHFGRPIEQISDMEQLTYMLHEMQTKYPKQYGVFMNPNSTDSMLQEASYRFWGWGVQGDRFRNAQSLLR